MFGDAPELHIAVPSELLLGLILTVASAGCVTIGYEGIPTTSLIHIFACIARSFLPGCNPKQLLARAYAIREDEFGSEVSTTFPRLGDTAVPEPLIPVLTVYI